jgi:hypothetical protein
MAKHLLRTIAFLLAGFTVAYSAGSMSSIPVAEAYPVVETLGGPRPPDEEECAYCEDESTCGSKIGGGSVDCAFLNCKEREETLCRPGLCDPDGQCENICEVVKVPYDCECSPFGRCG